MQTIFQSVVASRQFLNEDGQEVDVRLIFSPKNDKFVYVMTRDSRFEGSPFSVMEMRAIDQLTTEIIDRAYPNECHPTHLETVFSDASSYDEVCKACRRTNQIPGGWGELRFPCSANKTKPE